MFATLERLTQLGQDRRRLAGQLAGRDVEQKRSLLTVSTDRPDYELGKTVGIRIVRQPQPGSDTGPADVLVEIVDESGKNAKPVSACSGGGCNFPPPLQPVRSGGDPVAIVRDIPSFVRQV